MIVRTYDKIVEQSRFSRIVREKGKRKKNNRASTQQDRGGGGGIRPIEMETINLNDGRRTRQFKHVLFGV